MILMTLPLFSLIAPATLRAESAATNVAPEISISPSATYVTVKGDKEKFRENTWTKDYWTGGVEDATLHQQLGKDSSLDFEGRALFDAQDYKLRLEMVKPDIGFVRAGFTEYDQYYDGTGGFFRGFSTHAFELNRDLFLRNGDIFVELGLTLPNLPKLTLGYERQFRNGDKSLLEWGGVTQGSTTRNIYPSFKDVDETVDIFKAQAEHDIKNVHLADQFRFEHYRDVTKTSDGSVNLNTSASQSITVNEDYHHDAFYNTFHMDSHLNEKVYWSIGYMYLTLDGDAGFDLVTAPVVSGFDNNWVSKAVDIDTDSHVLNVNTMFGPFVGLSMYVGAQAEQTKTHGFSDALLTQGVLPTTTNLVHTTNNKQSIEETAGLRYTKIPFTTLYAEGKWNQQDIDLLEREMQNGAADFARETDTTIGRQDYTAGFNTAPLPRMTLAGRYRHSIYENGYDNLVDTEPGYPAFIKAQNFTIDEIRAKLTLRPCSRFSVGLKYQLLDSDIDTTTDGFSPLVPKGNVRAGNYNAAIYTVSATVTPLSRLYLTGLFSFQDTKTTTFDNGSLTVVDYVGNVYTVIGAAGYALDNKTDLTAQYTYSRSDDSQNNASTGLPLGLAYQQTGVLAGLTRQITKNMIVRLRYGFYEYHETSNGGLDNYIAHLASASCTLRF
jgi:hypothetical protein